MDSSKPSFENPDFSSSDEPASATGVFGTVRSPATPAPEDDLLKSLLSSGPEQGSAAPTSSPEPIAEPSSAAPSSFPQVYQTLTPVGQAPAKSGSEPLPPPASQKTPADLTGVFSQVSLNRPAAPVPQVHPAAPENKPGEFTQLLQTLNNPVVKDSGIPPAAPAEPIQQQASAVTGGFTQMFQALSGTAEKAVAPSGENASAPTAPFTPAAPAPPVAAPGSFTQMFQALSSEKPVAAPSAPGPPPAPPQPAAAGGFTQMFQALTTPKESLSPAPAPPQTAPVAKNGPGAFTQMFQQMGSQEPQPLQDPLASLKQEPAPEKDVRFSPGGNPFSGNSPRSDSGIPASGGFTQLFQALGKEETPAAQAPPLMPSAPVANPAPPAAGGFTQLLRTLNTDPAPQQPPASGPMAAPPAALPQNGPGEFTRIISGSMLREAQGQNAPAGPPVLPPQGQGSGQPAFQMPQMKMPTAPPVPQIPQIPQMHAGGGAAPQMPHFPQAAPFGFPPAPAPQAPPPSKLQQYLPLILVVNVFVLIVIVLIVIFALRHH